MDTSSSLLPSFISFAGDNKDTPQALRQKIALAMLMQKRKAPTNLGEGLSAIGDSLGDIGMMRRIEGEAAAAEQAGKSAESRILGDGSQAAAPSSQPSVASAEPAAPSALVPPPAQPTRNAMAPAPAPGSLPPTGAPGNTGADTFPPPGGYPRLPVLDQSKFNSIDAMAPNAPPALARGVAPPVMAQGEDDPRRAVALAMLKQGQLGQPQNPNFAPAAPAVPPPTAPPPNQGIALAPPPSRQIAPPPPPAAPQPNLPEAGYVVPLPPPRKPPPLSTPIMQSIEQEIRAASPSVRESVQARLMPLYQKEQGVLAQAHEAYKDGLIQDRAIEIKHHEQKAAARASVDAAAKAAEDLRKSREPTLQTDVEQKHIFNPATGQYEVPKMAGADASQKPTFKGNEFQGKALVNYGRARIAQEGLRTKVGDGAETAEEILASSPMQSALGAVPYGVTRSWRSDAFKEADTHADNFVQAFIRQQSGGAYGPAELESEARGMLPKYGDTPQQLKDKREQREQFLSGMYSIIGPSGQKGVEFDAAKREAERAQLAKEKPKKEVDPLEGREILLPDKTIQVRRNGKWVPK